MSASSILLHHNNLIHNANTPQQPIEEVTPTPRPTEKPITSESTTPKPTVKPTEKPIEIKQDNGDISENLTIDNKQSLKINELKIDDTVNGLTRDLLVIKSDFYKMD